MFSFYNEMAISECVLRIIQGSEAGEMERVKGLK
jgi:hypothetical protein